MARGGLEVTDVFRYVGPAFRDQHGASLSAARRRAMLAIESCRTAALGGHVERCGDCGHQRISYDSCRNRNCPKCQGRARAQWLEDRQAELLGVPYYHVVFTVPDEIAVIAFQNQTVVYDILFRAASETLRTIAADPVHLGAEIGFLAVLHTWGQALTHHPHLHCLVPGGGPTQVLDYVGRYTHGVAISNKRLVSIDDGKVRFRWKDYRDGNRQKIMTLEAGEFIRRFLIHVLPDGFHRIHYYGFLGNCHRARKLALCRELLGMVPPEPVADPPADYRDRFEALTGRSLRECPHCHAGIMVVIECIARPRVCQPVPDTS